MYEISRVEMSTMYLYKGVFKNKCNFGNQFSIMFILSCDS